MLCDDVGGGRADVGLAADAGLADARAFDIALHEALQALDEVLHGIHDQPHALGHRVAADLQGVGDIGKRVRVRTGDEMREQALGVRAQAVGGLGGQHDQTGAGRTRGRDGRRLDIFLEYDVHIGAAETERADAGAARERTTLIVERRFPILGLLDRVERRVVEIDVGIELLEVQQRRNLLVLDGQQYLQDAGDAGCGFEMADVGLGGRQADVRLGGRRQLMLLVQVRECLLHGLDLDRIAQAGAGAVAFEITDAARIDLGLFVGFDQQISLRVRVRRSQHRRLAAMVLGGGLDDRVDVVAVGDRIFQRLDQDRARAFTAHVSVGARVEGLALAVVGQHARRAEGDVTRGGEHDLHAADDRHVAAAGVDRLDRAMQGDQRTRTRSVQRRAGPVQIEQEGHAVDQNGVRRARGGIAVEFRLVHRHQVDVVAGRRADEQTGPGARQIGDTVAGILDRTPDALQENPLLRIHHFRFAWRDAPEQRIELVDLAHEAAPLRQRLVLLRHRIAVIRFPIPTILRNERDHVVLGLAQLVPVFVQVVGLRHHAAHPDDGDRPFDEAAPRREATRLCGRQRGRRREEVLRCEYRLIRDYLDRAGRSGVDGRRRCARLRMHAQHVLAVILGEMFGDLADAGIFEEQDRRDVQAVLVVDHVAERREPDRIEAQVQQDRIQIDVVGIDLEEVHDDLRQRALDRDRQITVLASRRRSRGGGGRCDGLGRRLLHADAPRTLDLVLHTLQHRKMRQIALQAQHERLDADIALQRADTEIALEEQRGLLVETHAAFGPDRPVQAERLALPLSGARARIALRGERIHEMVRVRVVALAGIARQRRQRRKHHEEIQRFVARRIVQQHRAADLGREHGRHFVARLVAQIRIAQHAGTVDDAVQPAVAVLAHADESFDVLAFGDVGRYVHHFAAIGAHGFKRRFGFGLERTATAQHHPRLELFRQVFGEDQAKTAGAAGDQIDTAMPDRRRIVHQRRGCGPVVDATQIARACAVTHRECLGVVAEFRCDRGDRHAVEAGFDGRIRTDDFDDLAREFRTLRAQDRREALDRLVVRLCSERRAEIQILQADIGLAFLGDDRLGQVQEGVHAAIERLHGAVFGRQTVGIATGQRGPREAHVQGGIGLLAQRRQQGGEILAVAGIDAITMRVDAGIAIARQYCDERVGIAARGDQRGAVGVVARLVRREQHHRLPRRFAGMDGQRRGLPFGAEIQGGKPAVVGRWRRLGRGTGFLVHVEQRHADRIAHPHQHFAVLVDDEHVHLRDVRRFLGVVRIGHIAVADRRERMQDLHFAQRVRHEHFAAGVGEARAHRGLERGVDQRGMQHELVEAQRVEFRDLQYAQHFKAGLRVAMDLLQRLEGRAETQTEGLELRIGAFGVADLLAASADRIEVDEFVLGGLFLRGGVLQLALAVELFAAALAFAEDLERHRVARGLQFDEDFVRHAVLDRQRADPEDVADPADLAPGGDFAGLAREIEVRDARQGWNVRDQMVVDEEFAVVEDLAEQLALERRFVAVDQWMQACGLPNHHGADRAALSGFEPMTLVRERIRRQRNAPALPTVLHALPFGHQAVDPQLRQLHRIARFREQIDECFLFLAAEHLGDALRILHVADEDVLIARARQEALQPVDQPLVAVGQNGDPVIEGFAAELQGEGDLVEAGRGRVVAMLLDEGFQPHRDLPQLLLVARGQRENPQAAFHRRAVGGQRGVVNRFQNHVRVGTARAEGADASAQRLQYAVDLFRMPRGQRLLDHERRMREIDELVELRRMQRRHQGAVTHLQDRLADARDARGRFQVPDIGLDRSDRAALQRDLVVLERLVETGDLDGIAQFGASAVGFDVADAARVQVGLFQRRGDDVALRLRVRHRIAAVAAAVADRRASDHRIDVVAVAPRLRQRLEQQRTDTFARHVAAGAAAEGATLAFFRQETASDGDFLLALVHIEIDAADQRGRAFAAADRVAGEMDRSQAGRARGVHRDAGAGEIHEVRDAIGDAPEERIRDHLVAGQALFRADHLVHRPHRTDVHADPARAKVIALEGFGIVAGVFQSFPADFQEQAFLRVKGFRFARRDIEEQRIETVEVVEKTTAVPAQHIAVAAAVEPRLRDLADAVAALDQILPELIGIPGLRQTRSHADDRDVHVVFGHVVFGHVVFGHVVHRHVGRARRGGLGGMRLRGLRR